MTQDSLRALPNGDLWRGHKEIESPNTKPTLTEVALVVEELSPIDKAMENVTFSARGANELSCLWCGMQGKYDWMKQHIVERHNSIINPSTNAEMAMHELATVQAALDAKE